MRKGKERIGWYFLAFAAAFAAGLILCRFVPAQAVEEMGGYLRGKPLFSWRDAVGCLARSALRAAFLILSARSRLGRISCSVLYLRLCVQAGFVFALIAACGAEGISLVYLLRSFCSAAAIAQGFSGDTAIAWLWLCLYAACEGLLLFILCRFGA